MNERMVCDAAMVRAAGDGAALKRILLCPDGLVNTSKGDFTFNAESYAAIRREFDARKKSTVIDWEHQSLDGDYAAPNGRAPAAGWIEALEYVPGEGLYGQVKWNDDAAEEIRKDHYRYLSPTVIIRKEGRLVVGLDSAALTNKPAIHGMPRLAAKQTEIGDMEMLKQLRELLRPHCPDLTDQADEAATLAACKATLAKINSQDTVIAACVREKLNLKPDAGREAIVVALANVSNDGERVAKLERELAAMRDGENKRRVDAMMEAEYAAGRVIRGTEYDTEARKLAETSPDAFKTLVSSRKPIVEQGTTKPPAGTGGTPKTREEIIAHATRAYDEQSTHPLTTKAEWVNGTLRQKGLARMTSEEEAKHLAIA